MLYSFNGSCYHKNVIFAMINLPVVEADIFDGDILITK